MVMEEITEEPGALVERIAALDVGKATLTVCVRVPHEDKPGARRQEVLGDDAISMDEEELRRIHATAQVARWWDAPGESFPWDEPESTRLTILADGAVAGLIQFREELEPKYRHAEIDLFLDPALHGRGIGTEAVRLIVRHLIDDRGHHRLAIDPARTNAAAIRAYEKVGFKPVGVMRRSERDADGEGWHDALLMELLAEEV